MNYTHILDLAKEAEPPADGILSRKQKEKVSDTNGTSLSPNLLP